MAARAAQQGRPATLRKNFRPSRRGSRSRPPIYANKEESPALLLEVTPGLADQKLNCFWATLPRAMLFLAGFDSCARRFGALDDEVSGGLELARRFFFEVRPPDASLETPTMREPAKSCRPLRKTRTAVTELTVYQSHVCRRVRLKKPQSPSRPAISRHR